ncbi:uncharacterized protein A1O9_00204 [Exophiala aquamarina CBS 119918]|uniref:Uncharacterized protein n=1 Tax=Exophiala aquamarina CBS 119918 TaxID=1182545 RepID=A0A072PR62_9EURO|nr:uncharacterized protein A1O9_00204 [Exophiala aquamarina CBS 119918]KEF62232.1 hypothetical protein A1O9_00204 [Exophiala aquamarina CBS 119918]
MTHDPDSASSISKAVNVNNHVAGTIASSLIVPSEGTRKRLAHNLQASSGDYFGDLGAMDTAPLVYPKLEELARGKRARMKAVGSFVSDYKDRRAQAEWASENSMSILAQGPRPQFRSRFSDPNHPASSGDILALVTAGKLSTSSLKEKMSSNSSIDVNHDSNSPSPSMPQSGGGHRAPRDNRRVPLVCNHENITPSPYGGYSEPPNFPPPRYTNHPEQYAGAYQYNRNTQANRNKEPRDSDDEEQTYGKKEKLGGTRGVLRSVLKKNVLYMMIVNLPSEAEMMQAQISLKGQQGNWRMQ